MLVKVPKNEWYVAFLHFLPPVLEIARYPEKVEWAISAAPMHMVDGEKLQESISKTFT
jgi:hypothetical protein